MRQFTVSFLFSLYTCLLSFHHFDSGRGIHLFSLFPFLETPVYCLSQAELWFTHFSSLSSILGMNLFGCKFCKQNEDNSTSCDRKNFDSLLWASITVFQVLPLCESVVRLWCLSPRRGCVGVCEGQCLCMLSLCSQQAIWPPTNRDVSWWLPTVDHRNMCPSDTFMLFNWKDYERIATLTTPIRDQKARCTSSL